MSVAFVSAVLVLRPPLLTEEQLKRQREEEEAQTAPRGVHGNIKPRKQARRCPCRSGAASLCAAEGGDPRRQADARVSSVGSWAIPCRAQVASWLSRPQSASAALSGCASPHEGTTPREGMVTRSQSSAQSTPRHQGDDDLGEAMSTDEEAD